MDTLVEELQALREASEMGPRLVLVLKVHGRDSVTLAGCFLSSSLSSLTCERGTLELPARHPCLGGSTDGPASLGWAPSWSPARGAAEAKGSVRGRKEEAGVETP